MSWSNGLTGRDVSQTVVTIASQVLTFENVSFALLLIFVSSLKKKKKKASWKQLYSSYPGNPHRF